MFQEESKSKRINLCNYVSSDLFLPAVEHNIFNSPFFSQKIFQFDSVITVEQFV